MKRTIISLLICLITPICAIAQMTIEDCMRMAEENYPIIKKYDLLSATKEIELSDINKGWLPRIGLYSQVTGQNIVPSFPETLTGVLSQMGQKVRGLGKIQYKLGADISQTIWDGGASRVRRELAEAKESAQKAALDVELYAVKERVINLYFAILLTEEQIAQNQVTHNLLMSNLSRLQAMYSNGTAMQSDIDMVEAQALTLSQQITSAHSAAQSYRQALGIFTGENLEERKLARPTAPDWQDGVSGRPELRLFDSRMRINQLSESLADTSLRPKVGFFVQAYYGYPGFDYFKSMINRNLSLNIMAGVKVSWNIEPFYIRKNNVSRIRLDNADIEADRDIFLFNTSMQHASETALIDGLRKLMQDDARIVELRGNVRKAAESQLANGIIDANALLTKISDENFACLNAGLHEIQLLHEIYKLKYILNL